MPDIDYTKAIDAYLIILNERIDLGKQAMNRVRELVAEDTEDFIARIPVNAPNMNSLLSNLELSTALHTQITEDRESLIEDKKIVEDVQKDTLDLIMDLIHDGRLEDNIEIQRLKTAVSLYRAWRFE